MRLTDSELASKRGFCAVCDATFDIAAGAVRDAMVPYRSDEAPVLELAKPPSSGVVVTGVNSGWLILKGTGATGWRVGRSLIVMTALFAFVIPAILIAVGSVFGAIFVLIALGLPLGTSVVMRRSRNASGHDRLQIIDGELRVENFPELVGGIRCLALSEISEVIVERDGDGAGSERRWCLRVLGKGTRSILVGRALGHDEATLRWVRDWLRAEIARAQGAEPRPALPPTTGT